MSSAEKKTGSDRINTAGGLKSPAPPCKTGQSIKNYFFFVAFFLVAFFLAAFFFAGIECPPPFGNRVRFSAALSGNKLRNIVQQ